MAEADLTHQALQLLNKHFEVEISEASVDGSNASQEEVRQRLIDLLKPEIRHMLDHSFEQLLHILYRIDLSEPKVIELLEKSAPGEVAANLTAAIVDRQMEKIKLREQYRNF